MSTPPQISLTLFFARENSRAVILRRGPHRMACLILWDRSNDAFEEGQWLKARVYEERCDLSPDGAHFLYFALDGRWQSESRGTYTAISRPPYFTAVAFFPEGDTWGGGGHFLDRRRYVLASGAHDAFGGSGLERAYIDPAGPPHFVDGEGRPLSFNRGEPPPAYPLRRFRPEDEHFATEGACLYRIEGDTRRLIGDFSDMAFKTRRAPYDTRAKRSGADWHPLGPA